MGLRYVHGLRQRAAESLVNERHRLAFTSTEDLARRVPELSKDNLSMLASIWNQGANTKQVSTNRYFRR
jgi:predicted nucleic acid-binding OB-fold protein